MPIQELYHQNAYQAQCETILREVRPEGIVLEQTVFYPLGGGQEGDSGQLRFADGLVVEITETRWMVNNDSQRREIVHIPAADHLPHLSQLQSGAAVTAEIDWARRYARMKLHTASHLLCALLPYPVNGCHITDGRARLDFMTNDPIDKEALGKALAGLLSTPHAVIVTTIRQQELAQRPDLIHTMSVQPPKDIPLLRLIQVEGVDTQACGGTHVQNTDEIGEVCVVKTEKKNAQNRRIILQLA